MAAVHHATDAIPNRCPGQPLRARSLRRWPTLHAPRLLPADYDVPYRYTPAPLSKAQPLLSGYTLAVEACTTATAALDELALAIEAPSRAPSWARQLVSADQRYPQLPAGPLRPGPRSAVVLQPRHIEHTLHNLLISDPDLLIRAAMIDEATRAITAEATMKASRTEIMTNAVTQSMSRDQRTSGRRPPRARV